MRWPWSRPERVPSTVWVVWIPDECSLQGIAATREAAMAMAEDDMGLSLTWRYSAKRGRWLGRVVLNSETAAERGGAAGVYEYEVRPWTVWRDRQG